MEKSSLYLAATWKLCSLTTPQALVGPKGEVVELPLLMICVLLYLSLRGGDLLIESPSHNLSLSYLSFREVLIFS